MVADSGEEGEEASEGLSFDNQMNFLSRNDSEQSTLCTTVSQGYLVFHLWLYIFSPFKETFHVYFTQGQPRLLTSKPLYKPALSKLVYSAPDPASHDFSSQVLYCAALAPAPTNYFDRCALRHYFFQRRQAAPSSFQVGSHFVIEELQESQDDFSASQVPPAEGGRNATYYVSCSNSTSQNLQLLRNDQKYQVAVFAIDVSQRNSVEYSRQKWKFLQYPSIEIDSVIKREQLLVVEDVSEDHWRIELKEPHFTQKIVFPLTNPIKRFLVLVQPQASASLPVHVEISSEEVKSLHKFVLHKYQLVDVNKLNSSWSHAALTISLHHQVSQQVAHVAICTSSELQSSYLPAMPALNKHQWDLKVHLEDGIGDVTWKWTPRLEYSVLVYSFYKSSSTSVEHRTLYLEYNATLSVQPKRVTEVRSGNQTGREADSRHLEVRVRPLMSKNRIGMTVREVFVAAASEHNTHTNCYTIWVGLRRKGAQSDYVYLNEATVQTGSDHR